MDQQSLKVLEKTVEFEFFKVKKILKYINYDQEDNLSYNRKNNLAEIVKYLVYS